MFWRFGEQPALVNLRAVLATSSKWEIQVSPTCRVQILKVATKRKRLCSPDYRAVTFMPKAGLEPACLAAPPPQDGVSANSTTSARAGTIYFVGALGAGAGAF